MRSWPYLLGLLTLFSVFLAEAYFLIPETTPYVLVILITLALSRTEQQALVAGVVATVFLSLGFSLELYREAPLTLPHYLNDFIGLAAIWVSVVLTVMHKRSVHRENQQRAMVDSLFRFANEAILIVDGAGHIAMANPVACNLFGYSAEEIVGREIECLVPDHLRPAHQMNRDAFLKNPERKPMPADTEQYGKRKDGSSVPVDVSLSPFHLEGKTYVVAFVYDVSERRRIEKQLKGFNARLEEQIDLRTQELTRSLHSLEDLNRTLQQEVSERLRSENKLRNSQRLYSAIASNFPDGWIGILNESFVYVFVDGKGIDGAGLTALDLLGKKFTDLVKSDNAIGELQRCRVTGQISVFEIQCEEHTCEVTALPFFAEPKEEVILVVMHDITKQKRRQESLMRALDKEKELSEMKSRFVTLASHEFRTPLATILSSTFLLESHSGHQFEAIKPVHIGRIKRAANLLIEILDDFLSLSKLEEGKIAVALADIDIPHFIGEFVEEMQQQKKGEQVIFFRHEGDNIILSDQKLLFHILSNLVTNAIKYAGEDGVIGIHSTTLDDSLRIEVVDNGIGIPPEDQIHLFERFYRAHNTNHIQGTGLGLNITKKYVQLLNGEIDFESKPESGTRFTVSLPITHLKLNEVNL
jgi:PAS domain S-box-containing protein